MWPRHRWGAGMGQTGGGGMPGFIRRWVCMSIYMDEYRRLSKVYIKAL